MRFLIKYIWVFLILSSCGNSLKTSKQPIYSTGNCPFSVMMWMEKSDSSSQQSEMDLNVSIKFLALQLKQFIDSGDLNKTSPLSGKIRKVNERHTSHIAKVSQLFYEKQIGQNTRLCNVWQFIQDNKKDSASLRIANNILIDILRESGASSGVERPNINNYGPVVFQMNGNGNLHASGITVVQPNVSIPALMLTNRFIKDFNEVFEGFKEVDAYYAMNVTDSSFFQAKMLMDGLKVKLSRDERIIWSLPRDWPSGNKTEFIVVYQDDIKIVSEKSRAKVN